MIQYFINRGGKGLSASRKRELRRAIRILQQKQAARRARETRRVRSKRRLARSKTRTGGGR
jgi:hypothetical protein